MCIVFVFSFIFKYSGSRLIGSIFKGIQGLVGLSIVSHPKCVSVNGIIRFMGSVCLSPKVIPLSGAHCIYLTKKDLITNDQNELSQQILLSVSPLILRLFKVFILLTNADIILMVSDIIWISVVRIVK